jgi:hypothetical protein
MKTYLVIFTLGIFCNLALTPEDFTDTGVGCTDDCLEPMEEGEDNEYR